MWKQIVSLFFHVYVCQYANTILSYVKSLQKVLKNLLPDMEQTFPRSPWIENVIKFTKHDKKSKDLKAIL